MSRIGKTPINIPDGVSIELNKAMVQVKGKKGTLEVAVVPDIKVSKKENQIAVERLSDQRQARAMHGTVRQLIASAIIGVSDGFKKDLTVIGVGYSANMLGSRLVLQLGYSHDIIFEPPKGIEITTGKGSISIAGFDKQLVGEVAAKIRSFRKPEPFKGKGIRYKDEHVRRKQGKTVGGVG